MSEIHILEGSYISPEFYQEGENIYEGKDKTPEYCWSSDVLLKRLNLRLFGTVEEMHKRFENAVSCDDTDYDDSSDSYDNSYDSRDWLSDAAGTNDPDVMRDVYWNLD